jgi:RND family efflux transporter MFP subunit
MEMKRHFLNQRFVTALLICLAIPVVSASDTQQGSTVSKKVSTAIVSRSDVADVSRYSGVLRAANRAALTFTVPGRMVQRPVRIGDRVAVDQVIARLDDAPFAHAESSAKAQMAEIDANLDQARRDVARLRKLVSSKAATTEELEQNEAAVRALEAAKNRAAVGLDETVRLRKEAVLRASFAGTVTGVMLEPGEFASPGAPVLEMSGLENLELEIEVPEKMIPGLRAGSEVDLVLPLSDRRRIRGVIRSVGQSSGRPGSLFPVLIDVQTEEGLVSGMTVEWEMNTINENALVLPISAVVNPSGNAPKVFLVSAGVVRSVPVEVLGLAGERVMVSGDLSPGDEVVVKGVTGLMDGQTVEVR